MTFRRSKRKRRGDRNSKPIQKKGEGQAVIYERHCGNENPLFIFSSFPDQKKHTKHMQTSVVFGGFLSMTIRIPSPSFGNRKFVTSEKGRDLPEFFFGIHGIYEDTLR